MSATIGDVARHAGVSISTVSYVLSGKRTISAETREKVERVVRELGYRPHAGARALASKRSNAIALVAPFRTDNNVPVLMQYVSTVATSARSFDHDVLLVTQEEGDSGVHRVSSSSLVDALIVMDVEADDARLDTLRSLSVPSVLIGIPDRANGLTCIDIDRREAAALAVTHLHELGHRDIALLGSPPAAYERRSGYALQFLEGYTRMVDQLGIRSADYRVEPTFDAASEIVDRLFAEHPSTTGIVVHNEAILGSVLAVLDRLGKRVPSDVSVVAHCPDDMAVNQRVPLTSIDLAATQIASLAVTMVIGKLAGDTGGETRLIAPTLTVRESTATASSSTMSPKDAPSMKFNNGYWLLRDGISGSYATETVDVRLTEDDISAAALTKPWLHRGSHLNTSTITVDLRSPRPDVVTVRVSHLQRPVLGPSFDVADEHPDVTITSADGRASIESGDLTASITTHGEWSLRFETAGGEVTSAGLRDAAFMRVAESTGERSYMVQRLALPVGAHVYGLGERFTAFVKNGQVVESWNEDGGTASEQSYKAIPLLVTDAGFGVFVDSPGRVSFEIGSEVVSALQFSVPGEEVVFHVIQGTPEEILEHYTAMTGRPALPPKWSLGLWLTTSFTTDYDEETVTHFVDGMVDRGIPLSVFHFDTYWMRPLNWCDFTWDEDSFPDPEGMLRRLSERGLRTSVWINPYLGQRSPLYREAAEAGYLLRRADGSVWQWDMWVAGMGIVDFTNPAAREWYSQKVRGLLRQGVSAIKADFGERIPTDVVWSDGSDPESMHNYYSYLYNKTVFDAVVAERGANEAVLFARSATAGGQQFPVHWGGDSEATYASMAESLRGGLSLGLSGFGFWSHDIGGFERTPTAALFKRWLLFGYFSSHARLHGSDSYRVPWAFDEEAVDVARDFGRLRNELAPYLWNAAVEAHEHGVPMMRAMVLAFPDDPACATLDLQYMLGRDLLVAPVFSDEGTVRFYVPAGRWIGLLDGEERIGPAWMRETHGFDSLPLLVRAGTVVPRSSSPERPDVDYAERPVFEVFGLDDGAEATASLRDDAGEVVCTVTVARAGELLTARLDGDVPSEWTLRWAAVGEARPVEAVAQGKEALELRIG